LQLGPKAAEFLANSPAFILKIRSGSGKKAVGAPRSRKGVQPQVRITPPTISIRKKYTRMKTPDDALESFTPNDSDDNFDFDDIEPEPEQEPWLDPQELSVPPLVQARMLRASPSIQVVEHPVEDSIHKKCLDELDALCIQVGSSRLPPARPCHIYLSSRGIAAASRGISSVTQPWNSLASSCLAVGSLYFSFRHLPETEAVPLQM
jgi:hypothetical protein